MTTRNKSNYFLTILFGVIYLVAMFIGMYFSSFLTDDKNMMVCVSVQCFFMGLWAYFFIKDSQKNG